VKRLSGWDAVLLYSELYKLEPFRYQLVDIPLKFHHPMWRENCDVDLDYCWWPSVCAHPSWRPPTPCWRPSPRFVLRQGFPLS